MTFTAREIFPKIILVKVVAVSKIAFLIVMGGHTEKQHKNCLKTADPEMESLFCCQGDGYVGDAMLILL